MTRVLLDINVILDVLATREPFADDAEADYLVTRDKRGFKKAPVKIVTPAELLALMS